jgi:hypothetical protein
MNPFLSLLASFYLRKPETQPTRDFEKTLCRMIYAFFGSRLLKSIFETAQCVFRIANVLMREISNETAHRSAEVTFLVDKQ